jgi:hypothetical protein
MSRRSKFKGSKLFFFEKKKQKTFAPLEPWALAMSAPMSERFNVFFYFLFAKSKSYSSSNLTNLAGLPAYTPFGSVERKTIEPAPMTQPGATTTPGRIVELAPIQQPS